MKKLICVALGVTLSVAALAGCTYQKRSPDTESTLEVYAFDAGYGVDWVGEMLDLFADQDWVKEKYPNLNILQPITNDVSNFAESKLNAGERSNTIDLIFGTNLFDYAGPNGDLLDLTESVYNSPVPGETDESGKPVLWIDKAIGSYNESNRYIDTTNLSSESYYTVSWAAGMNSFVYNETILNSFGLDVPNTTDDLEEVCAIIKANEGKDNGKYNEGYSFVQSREADYWSYLFPVWWAQYEGVSRYLDFWNGIDNDIYSVNIFRQQGRVKSLEVYEDLLAYSKGYLSLNSFLDEFMMAQTSFLQGHGVFHVNGDWFAKEMEQTMSDIISEEGGIDSFKTMRMPVVSALGVKLGIEDSTLSDIIDYLDGDTASLPDFESTAGYTDDAVVAAVREARTIVHSIGPNHTAVIPAYANGKDVAVDFLRFMATDIAQESYIRSTGGASLPFNYDLKEKNIELYNELHPLLQSRHDYFNAYEIYTLPSDRAFPLARYGGIKAFVTEHYYTTFSANGNQKTPGDYYDETISAWTSNKFNNALSNSGIVR